MYLRLNERIFVGIYFFEKYFPRNWNRRYFFSCWNSFHKICFPVKMKLSKKLYFGRQLVYLCPPLLEVELYFLGGRLLLELVDPELYLRWAVVDEDVDQVDEE